METNKTNQTEEVKIVDTEIKAQPEESKTSVSDSLMEKSANAKKTKQQFSEEDEKLYKTKMRSLIVNTALIILMIVYLLNANQILFAFTKGPTDLRPVQHTLEQYPNSAPTHAQVEELTYLGGLTRNVRFYGWAFTESPEIINPVGKQTKIVLTGPSGSFEADCVVSARPDIYRAYTGIYGVPSGTVGFEARFSTLPLKSGKYSVQLFAQETQDIVGLSPPVMEVIVEPNDVYDVKYAPVDNFKKLQPSEELQIGIDGVEKTGSNAQMLKINGWGLDLRGFDPNVSTYLQIKNKKGKTLTFSVERTLERIDLMSTFNIQPDNTMLGFSTQYRVPSNFGDVKEIAFIVTKDGEERISMQPYIYKPDPSAAVAHVDEQTAVDNFENIQPNSKVTMAVDSLTRTAKDENLFTVTGWALNNNGRGNKEEAFLMVTAPNGKSITYPLQFTGERSDLVEVFGIKEGILSGFSQDFRIGDDMDGIKTITVVFKEKTNIFSAEKPFENTADEIPVAEDSTRVKGGTTIETSVPSNLVQIGIDSINIENNTVSAEGWAVCLPDLPQPKSAYLQLTDTNGASFNIPITFSSPREDVAEVHGFESSKLVGFTVSGELPENFGNIIKANSIFDCGGEFYHAEIPYVV